MNLCTSSTDGEEMWGKRRGWCLLILLLKLVLFPLRSLSVSTTPQSSQSCNNVMGSRRGVLIKDTFLIDLFLNHLGRRIDIISTVVAIKIPTIPFLH